MQSSCMIRIQRQRTKGWKMPPNSVYVGRPSKWGNKYLVGGTSPEHSFPMSRNEVIKAYGYWLVDKIAEEPHFLDELRGKDLVCWCKPEQNCHADVLIYFIKLSPSLKK